MGYDIVSLGDLISRYQERDGDLNRLTSYLGTFSCTRNTDLEVFFHERAHPHAKKDLTRTFQAVSEDYSILGYINLNLRYGIVPPGNVSKSSTRSSTSKRTPTSPKCTYRPTRPR